MEAKIKVGDVVRLNHSPTVIMTVINGDTTNDYVRCSWFDPTTFEVREKHFPVSCLKIQIQK